MSDWHGPLAIGTVGAACYGLRLGGFFVSDALSKNALVSKVLHFAPGNISVAFIVAGLWNGGLPCVVGCVAALATMVITSREWAALAAGFATAALMSFFR